MLLFIESNLASCLRLHDYLLALDDLESRDVRLLCGTKSALLLLFSFTGLTWALGCVGCKSNFTSF